MRPYTLLFSLLFILSQPAFTQNDTALTPKQAIEILKQIGMDTSHMLRDYGEKACNCIATVRLTKKADKEIVVDIANCIERQTILFETMMETNRAMRVGNLNPQINTDKDSPKYKEYYYRLEEWLRQTCPALENALTNDNKESQFSKSKDPKALKFYDKGENLLRDDTYKEALAQFLKAVEIDPKFAFAWDDIGVCYRNLGDLDRAMDAYNKSLALDSNGKTPLQNIPIIYQFRKEYDKAIAAYDKLLSVFPGDAEGYFGAGRMYVLKGDYEKGLDKLCKSYNIYVEMGSPYRVDAQTLISLLQGEMRRKDRKNHTTKY